MEEDRIMILYIQHYSEVWRRIKLGRVRTWFKHVYYIVFGLRQTRQAIDIKDAVS